MIASTSTTNAFKPTHEKMTGCGVYLRSKASAPLAPVHWSPRWEMPNNFLAGVILRRGSVSATSTFQRRQAALGSHHQRG